ncbi:MAG: hypothetical protein WC464_06140 [Bdellovibrionales bacterium]
MISLKFYARLPKKVRIGILAFGAIAIIGAIIGGYGLIKEARIRSEIFEEKRILGLTIDEGLMGAMRGEAAQAEIALIERQQWQAIMELLYMRLYEKDYLSLFDDADLERHKKYGDILEQEVGLLRIPENDKNYILERVKGYRNYFSLVAETTRKINSLTETIGGNGVSIKVAPATKGSSLPWGMMAAFAMAALFIASVFYARFVLFAVKKLARYMESLAAGEFQETVPFAGSGGDIGKMASAIRVFKGNMFRQATQYEDQTEFAEELLQNVDVLKEAADQLAHSGNEIMRQTEEVVRVSHSVSDEVADINSHILGLARKVDDMDAAIKRGGEAMAGQAAKEKAAQVEEIKEGANKAVSKILFVNDVVMKAKTLSVEIAGAVEKHGAATRDIIRGLKHVAASIHKKVSRN